MKNSEITEFLVSSENVARGYSLSSLRLSSLEEREEW